MNPFVETRATPDKLAIVVGEREMSYRDLDRNSRLTALALSKLGIAHGETVAILAPNAPEFFIPAWAAQRSGLYYTPIGRHLKVSEIAYILGDSGARALFVDASLAERAREALQELADDKPTLIALNGEIAGGPSLSEFMAGADEDAELADVEGGDLLYTSGTTGRPKGVKRTLSLAPLGSDTLRVKRLSELFAMDADTVFYTSAPIYHAAPLRFAMTVIRMGATLALDEKFEASAALTTLKRRHVTHSQWAPTMFVRLLQLPENERAAFHAPAHRKAIHSGAPCTVAVKRAMIDWWGPILHEYYSGTESAGFTHLTSEEWLKRPGSVGKPWGCEVHVLAEDGRELGPGKIGAIHFEGTSGLSYHNDEAKTREAHSPQGWATMGDIGYLDDEGYLFLCDRTNFVIISGGINIYPREIEEVLESHPDVLEAAVFGLPDNEYGENVQAVVQLRAPEREGAPLAEELHRFVRARLAGFKAPKRIAFERDLPRLPNGKMEKRRLRDDYRARSERGFAPVPNPS
jgi:long-chain acyl-CoA synthetase